METRPGCIVYAIIVTSCHRNSDEAWSTSCLIMQHKLLYCWAEFHGHTEITWLDQWRTITDHGGTTPDKCGTCTNVTFRTEFKYDFKWFKTLIILPIPVICLVALHSYTNLHTLCSDSSFWRDTLVAAQQYLPSSSSSPLRDFVKRPMSKLAKVLTVVFAPITFIRVCAVPFTNETTVSFHILVNEPQSLSQT